MSCPTCEGREQVRGRLAPHVTSLMFDPITYKVCGIHGISKETPLQLCTLKATPLSLAVKAHSSMNHQCLITSNKPGSCNCSTKVIAYMMTHEERWSPAEQRVPESFLWPSIWRQHSLTPVQLIHWPVGTRRPKHWQADFAHMLKSDHWAWEFQLGMSQWLLVITLTCPWLIIQHWDIIGRKTVMWEAGGTLSGEMQKHAFTPLQAPHLQVERVLNMWGPLIYAGIIDTMNMTPNKKADQINSWPLSWVHWGTALSCPSFGSATELQQNIFIPLNQLCWWANLSL